MITSTHIGAKHVHAFQHRKEIPPFRARHQLEDYINALHVELERAQQTLDAIESQPQPKKRHWKRVIPK